jgi:hypothetical protein
MRQVTLMKEFLRVSRRLKLDPSADLYKKLEYLKFIGANACPACGDEIEMGAYICRRDEQGGILEKYICPSCGMDYVFPPDVIQ